MNTIDNNCKTMVDAYHSIMADNKYFALLKRLGRNFFDIADSHNYERGEPNACYNNAWRLAVSNPELTYCEGYAMSVIPMAHAWCVTDKGVVIETTWEKPGTEYFGIPFHTGFVRMIGRTSGYPSILDNYNSRQVYETPDEDFLQAIPK